MLARDGLARPVGPRVEGGAGQWPAGVPRPGPRITRAHPAHRPVHCTRMPPLTPQTGGPLTRRDIEVVGQYGVSSSWFLPLKPSMVPPIGDPLTPAVAEAESAQSIGQRSNVRVEFAVILPVAPETAPR